MQISITTNFPQVQAKLDSLSKDIAQKALVRSVNATMAIAKTAMSREIRQEFVLPAAKVNAALVVKRASFRAGLFGVEATLESPSKRGRSLNLINFGARETARGVTFKIKRGGPRQLIPGAFIASAGRTVFIRTGKPRLPIKALQTIDVAQMFNTQRINARVVKTLEDRFPQIFEREAAYYLRKAGLA